jgi:indolepyruvate ferredoxin oxidoreductase, alpha subunit
MMSISDPLPLITGSEALAYGALEAGVHLVTGYPGSPVTAAVDAYARLSEEPERVVWAINEKSAADHALGVSLAGGRALLCVKSPGFNVALDCLMVANLAPGDGGFVILVGDDPGGWGSQSEEDSRPLVQALELPMLEPASVAQARQMMRYAFELSEELSIPVVVRVIHALTIDRGQESFVQPEAPGQKALSFARQRDRWTVLPAHVVRLHDNLQKKNRQIQQSFETSPFNSTTGSGQAGLIAAGFAHRKLLAVLDQSNNPPVKILQLGTLYPLPAEQIIDFLRQVDKALVIEETAPLLETNIRSIAQKVGLMLPINGRESGHLPGAGELTSETITRALADFMPEWGWPAAEKLTRSMISRKPFCDGCPYIPVFDQLTALMEKHGGRDHYMVSGETGCLVRGQLPPWEMLDVKYSMGSSIGIAAGMQRAGILKKIISLSGDSAFLHNGFGEMVDAVQAGRELLLVILDNNVTALTGGQPHPATHKSKPGTNGQSPIDLKTLVRAGGVNWVKVVDPMQAGALVAALEEGMLASGIRVVISRHPCPLY